MKKPVCTWMLVCVQVCVCARAHRCVYLRAIDFLQVQMVESVDKEGSPQSQTHDRVSLWINGHLLQSLYLLQSC